MIRKPLCNHVHTSEDFLACYRSYKTDLPLSRLSFWSITFVGSIKRSKWPEKENFHLKLNAVAHLNLFLLLASLRYGFFFATLPWSPESRSRLFTADVDTGVLRVLFNEDASWGPVRRLFLKLQTLMYLSSCSVVQRGLPLLFLLWLEPVCAVNGPLHTYVDIAPKTRHLQLEQSFTTLAMYSVFL